mmetsp:Transcript_5512/g.23343  ORF Transcript_5512/g.23343 Transcript_5512/m.23343 type:complete len:320 (-) Transcript_5512:1532-2491(-)
MRVTSCPLCCRSSEPSLSGLATCSSLACVACQPSAAGRDHATASSPPSAELCQTREARTLEPDASVARRKPATPMALPALFRTTVVKTVVLACRVATAASRSSARRGAGRKEPTRTSSAAAWSLPSATKTALPRESRWPVGTTMVGAGPTPSLAAVTSPVHASISAAIHRPERWQVCTRRRLGSPTGVRASRRTSMWKDASSAGPLQADARTALALSESLGRGERGRLRRHKEGCAVARWAPASAGMAATAESTAALTPAGRLSITSVRSKAVPPPLAMRFGKAFASRALAVAGSKSASGSCAAWVTAETMPPAKERAA